MKFLCDRCKTRYSIGDDRVRGKILKIRCKNCANVITVREGMSDTGADLGPRRNRTTTAAPSAIAPPVAMPATTNGARAPKPPAALEEEWYVSIDGEQEGPYSLVDAQRWVAGKAIDADLHCWSEGFDDWLPVDKVSHFRGLRKKPAAPSMPAPPPLPRAATAAANLRVPESEKTPKPLFAATMASIEKSAQAQSSMPPGGLDLPPPKPRPSATPPGGEKAMPLHAKSNGAALPASPFGKKSEALKDSDAFGPTDGATQIDSTPFDHDVPTAAPVAARPAATPVVAPRQTPAPSRMPSPFPRAETKPTVDAAQPLPDEAEPDEAAVPSQIPGSSGSDDEDDGLAIGEVSRVVKLADLMASAKPKPASATRRPTAMGASGPAAAMNRTGSVPRISQTNLTARVDDPAAAIAAGIAPDALDAPHDMAAPPAVQETHRRGLFVLIGVAGVLLAGVIVAVLLLLGGKETTDSSLGRQGGIDTTRPDDPLHPAGTGVGSQVADTNPFLPPVPKNPVRPKNPINTNNPQNPTIDTPGGDRIGGDEVEAMAAKNSGMTQSCYRRAQRGANSILIGDVKKINVTLDIDPTGLVKSVSLDSNSGNDLGKCLISAIKAWKFRASPGGTYRFALVFSSN
ncbi:MAG TPA: GYF domain-containing protein [Kofleriaceae bacterium]